MAGLFDIYILSAKRNRTLAEKFLDKLLPARVEATCEHELPQYSDEPERFFPSAEDLMDYLVENPGVEYIIYWNNRNETDEIRTAMINFTADGGMIVGVSIDNESEERWRYWLNLISSLVDGKYGYVVFETPPCGESSQFINQAVNSPGLKLVDGVISNK